MKKILFSLFILVVFGNASKLVHPLDFQGSAEEKEVVISYITTNVKKTYTQIGMGDDSTLRMMENQELKAFKALTQVTNRKLLDSVITQYCNIGMCNYSTIQMMYNQQYKASKKTLKW